MTVLSKVAFLGAVVYGLPERYALRVFDKNNKLQITLLKVLATLHALDLFRKGKTRALAIFLAMIPSFKLKRVKTTLLGHFTTYMLLGRGAVGKKLAPSRPPPSGKDAELGIWQRHKIEAETFKILKSNISGGFFVTTNWRQPFVPVAFIKDPDMVRQVMEDKVAFPTRGRTGFSDFVQKGLLSMETGEEWQLHRRLVSKFLSNSYLKSFQNVIREEVEEMLDMWDSAGPNHVRNLHYDFQQLTLEVIMRIAFGDQDSRQSIKEEDNQRAHDLDYVLKHIVIQTAFPFLKYLPFTGQSRVNGIVEAVDEEERATFNKCLEALGEGDSPKTMLSSLIAAAEAGLISRDDVRDELQTIKGAGHETSSNTACWAMVLLSEHPEIMLKVREEAMRIFPDTRTPTFEQAKQLEYTRSVMYETLRLFPTVPSFPRECVLDTKLGDYDIIPGSMVFVSQEAMNKDVDTWGADAEEFRPERFSNVGDLSVSKPVGVPDGPAYGFLPFGAGARTCIGSRLAVLEIVTIVSSIVKNADVDVLIKSEDIVPVADVTLGPKNGLPTKVRALQ